MNWIEVGRFLIVAGTVIIIIGFVFVIADKIPLSRLPGDIQLGSGKFKVYIPLGTSILLSVIITLILNFFSKK
jgi:hypothetical protein